MRGLIPSRCAAFLRLPSAAAQLLLTYPWPGNVRELENVMQRALVLCDGDLVREAHIIFDPAPAAAVSAPPARLAAVSAAVQFGLEAESGSQALAESLALAEQKIILQALRSHATRERVAERLGISPRTLRYKLAQLRASGVAIP